LDAPHWLAVVDPGALLPVVTVVPLPALLLLPPLLLHEANNTPTATISTAGLILRIGPPRGDKMYE
jgi:hypothetical protein